jgi:uncharacterized membrane protein
VNSVPDGESYQRAANAYVIWPLAALDLFREPVDATAWSRLHTRQAFVFGIAMTLAYFALLALPLIVVIAISNVSTGAVLWLYALGVAADLAGAVVWLVLSLRYRERAARGDLFAIPLVTPVADRLFRLDR